MKNASKDRPSRKRHSPAHPSKPGQTVDPARSRTRYLDKKTLEEAVALFTGDQSRVNRRPERIPAEDSLGRLTAEAIFARASVPHYHGAAMDGIAVRAADTFGASEATPIELRRAAVGRTTAASSHFAYVDTGQPLPRWANAVIMIENVYPVGDGRLAIHTAAPPWQHVRLVGEDIVATEALLPRGHRIRPYDIGALLAAGHVTVSVLPRPVVAILPTGTELVEPGKAAKPGAITEFNSRVVAAFVTEWGGQPHRLPPVADDPDKIRAALEAAAHDHDVVVVIAGSSAGEHDYTVGCLRQLGEILVHGINIMPGKPAICARIGNTPVLGVPGYPVSAVIVCQQLLRPLLARLTGCELPSPETARAVVPRKIPSRLGLEEFVRVTLGRVGGKVVANPLARGAGVITTMVRADALLRIPSHAEGVNAGEEVTVELLRPAADIEHTILFGGSHDMTIGLLEDTLKQSAPHLKISVANVGSLGGLIALQRGEAHLVGTHLLDPRTGTYNVRDIRRVLGKDADILVVHLLVRQQGLIVRKGNPKRIRSLKDLARTDVHFVNRQSGAGTRVLLDYQLQKLGLRPRQVQGYDREEFTHMAVAVAVASGLVDCGLGIRPAATALGLDFIPVEKEDYDLVLRRDFADSDTGRLLLEAVGSTAFRTSVAAIGGYDVRGTGTIKRVDALTTRNRVKSLRAPRAVRGKKAG